MGASQATHWEEEGPPSPNAWGIRDAGLIPGSGRYPGVGNGNMLQYSCQKKSWTEEPDGLQFIRLQRVRHNLSDWAYMRIKRFHSVSSVTPSCLHLWPHGLQHTQLPCPSPAPGACWNSCPSSQWYHPTISSCVVASCLQSFLASGSFPMN